MMEDVLEDLANRNRDDLNWTESVVDLLKLLKLRSDLSARGTLAQRLNVRVDADGRPRQNIALYKAVVKELTRTVHEYRLATHSGPPYIATSEQSQLSNQSPRRDWQEQRYTPELQTGK